MRSIEMPPTPGMPAAHDDGSEPAFFRYHGVMSPGIRAFRRIGFPAKAAWVSMAFLLPIVLLATSLWITALGNIDFSARERVGVRYVRAVLPVLQASQNLRRAAASQAVDLPQARQALDEAMQRLAEVQNTLGAELNTTEAWDKLRQQVQQANAGAHGTGGPGTAFSAHTAVVEAGLRLLNDAADNSNLTLDPDLNTFYLMDASVFAMPQLAEQFARLRGMGMMVLRAGSTTAEQHDGLNTALAFAQTHQAQTEKSLQRATAADATLKDELHLADMQDASRRFTGLVLSQALGDMPGGDPAAFLAQANTAIELQYKTIHTVLEALDKRLALRVDGLRHVLMLQSLVSLFGLVVAVYLLVAFYRVTQGGIAEVARQLREISQGNLTLQPRPWGRDEVASLMNTLAATLDALRRTVTVVRDGAGEIHTASSEVAAASLDLSHRTEQTASQLQRTASAMSQIGGTVSQSAESARHAAELVARNAAVAAQGGSEVNQVVDTMGEIRRSSGRIEEIIATIDGIAFQTNILALNAAVEAARAGEAGRGFAVVASEVRNLAQRSSSAAREIKGLIGASVGQVETGSTVVGQAGHTMRQIVDQANQIKQLISEISDGTLAQTSGLSEVNQSVEQLDGMTQQNAALVEQTAAAAASLHDSVQRLNQSVAFFRIA
ncbi:methyl-accepting chemotaxis protein [Ideonella sp. DXS22W]|uniref:Methyl-accepting chemotaxis protein n=1 Tax=Pseudaquabacterium inlustre TaxID=2984192 RepID=A0ABU9CJM1_9BURK